MQETTELNNPSATTLLAALQTKGYPTPPLNPGGPILLIGVRTAKQGPNIMFDDWLVCVYQDGQDGPQAQWLPCTLAPGAYACSHPASALGTICLKEGYWPKLWSGYTSRGEIAQLRGVDCLEQIGACQVYCYGGRNEAPEWEICPVLQHDPSRDGWQLIDNALNPMFTRFNILAHANPGNSLYIGTASAGCVVPQELTDMLWLAQVVRMNEDAYGRGVDLYLLKDADISAQ